MSSKFNRSSIRFSSKNAIAIALSLSAVLLGGCSVGSAIEKLHPYRMDVRQGNYVDQGMLSKLRPGMTQDQVRLIMGSPLLTDIFHKDRWDYVYRFTDGSNGAIQDRRIALIFEQEKLVRVEGDVVPATGEARDVPTTPRLIEIEPQKP
jgi:outer membrane protein assembly factor BamE